MEKKCPGQSKQTWKPDDIFTANCRNCGTEIEFWKDDIARTCPKCRQRVNNPKINLGCVEWCKYAKECIGEEEYNRIKAKLNAEKAK
ncbi:MAG: hypothetical protein HZA48_06410 [Planctomycetes bacterium]|nr:hypothetical protein [Planctomycetota bacterium]